MCTHLNQWYRTYAGTEALEHWLQATVKNVRLDGSILDGAFSAKKRKKHFAEPIERLSKFATFATLLVFRKTKGELSLFNIAKSLHEEATLCCLQCSRRRHFIKSLFCEDLAPLPVRVWISCNMKKSNGAALDVALHTRGRGPVEPADGLWSRSKPERTFQSKASKLYSKTKSRKAFATSSKLKLVKERLTRAPEFFIRFYGEIHPTANCPWSSTSISLCGNRCQWPPCADQSVWERPIHSVVRGLEHATVLMGPMEFCRAPRQMLL